MHIKQGHRGNKKADKIARSFTFKPKKGPIQEHATFSGSSKKRK